MKGRCDGICSILALQNTIHEKNNAEEQLSSIILNSVANKFTDNLAATKYRRVLKEMALKFYLIEEKLGLM